VNRSRRWTPLVAGLIVAGIVGCRADVGQARTTSAATVPAAPSVADKVAQYTPVRLNANLEKLGDADRRMLPLLVDAAREMDTIFRLQAYAAEDSLLRTISDSTLRQYVEINYGPWDRLDGWAPFVPGVGTRPPGGEFYPHDMTKDEFEAAAGHSKAAGEALRSLYTVVRRDSAGQLTSVPYHEAYPEPTRRAVAKLREAAALARDPKLRRYLELRARALETDEYRTSDLAWMDMKDNPIDVVIGPIETYEDELFGYKAAHEAYVLVKDQEWSRRLSRYIKLLPALQRGLPVPQEYKREKPGSDSDLNAYDVVYYAGSANAGSKTIAINLPNDEEVQLRRGTRRLQLKNAMRAKFDQILVPIADELIVPEQRRHIGFDPFFANIMFHEVAHGLGIKNTIDGKGTVREALKEQASALEEAKADILGLYMVTRLQEQGELPKAPLDDYYVTFLAGIIRSVRFGAGTAHGRANAAEFSFLRDQGAFVRDSATGRYRVELEKMRAGVDSMAQQILRFQGDGDYAGVTAFMRERGTVAPDLQADLDRLATRKIPVDVVFEQGPAVLGLEQ
jgi:peptidase M49-like protein